MLRIGVILFFTIPILCIGQNLVPNPSFESFTLCPTGGSQVDVATPWEGTSGSCDYYNSCAPACAYGVPCTVPGSFQNARTGDAMAGLWMLNGYGNSYREYLEVQLLDTLEIGKCYLVSFYVNLQRLSALGVNNHAAHFSAASSSSSGDVLSYTPDVWKYGGVAITDTLNWVKVSGVYESNGIEEYLVIGNFEDDSDTDTLSVAWGSYPGSYYFVDDVSVIPVDSISGGLPAFAGNDTTIYYGDSLFVGQELTGLSTQWYNSIGTNIASGEAGFYVQPDSTTFYTVEQNLCGVITHDTIFVTVDTSNIGLEVINSTDSKIVLYPNPSNGIFNILLPEDVEMIELDIFDMSGKTVFNLKELVLNHTLQLETGLAPQVYLLKIKDERTGQQWNSKLFIVNN